MTTTLVDDSKTFYGHLDKEQIGHIRHIRNLLNQPPGDWSHMLGKGPAQDDFGAIRYQLAYMTYALALAHKHRLPAAPGVFKPLFERSMEKMLSSDVWIYWRDASKGGAVFNAHVADSLEETWDPVARDNIMYSAYVQSMALLHNYLFNDDRYAQPGALTFSHYTPFWGQEHRFEYDQNSLSDHIYWLMAENGFLGVACEPNCIFQICIQPAILGFRVRDMLEGTSVADQVVRDYEAAWKKYGRLDENGHYFHSYLQNPGALVPNVSEEAEYDAWAGALMNMWNRDFVHTNYPRQIGSYLTESTDGALSVKFPKPSTLFPPGKPVVPVEDVGSGWTSVWAAEMGDEETLSRLLQHVDRYMNPTWSAGGLYYPRNDTLTDSEGNRTAVAPIEGNALYSYARLNVPDGMWKLYNIPWDKNHFEEPALTYVADDVDISRAYYDPARLELHFSAGRCSAVAGEGRVTIGNVGHSRWAIFEDGCEVATLQDGKLTSSGSFAVHRNGPDYDLVFADHNFHDCVLKLLP